MTEMLKVNLYSAYLFLRITSIVAGALIACAVVYGNLDKRMDSYETAKAVNQAKMERMDKDMEKVSEKLDKIYDYMVSSKHSPHIAEGGNK